MADIPERLERQFARAARRRKERRLEPVVLGGIVGIACAFVVLVVCAAIGVRLSHRAGTILVTTLACFVGPLAFDQLIHRYPEWCGFEPEPLD